MFILYPEYAMATVIPGGNKYILRKGDPVILQIKGKSVHYDTDEISKNKEIHFSLSLANDKDIYKEISESEELHNLKFGPNDLNMLANMLSGVGVNSVMIETTWVLYSLEFQSYYKLGDRMMVSSRRLNMYNKIVRFKNAYISKDGAVVILEDDNTEYKLINSSYTGETYIEDIFSGIPFYADIHCTSDGYMVL